MSSYMLPIRSSIRYLGAARSIAVYPIASRSLQTEASAAGEEAPPSTGADGVQGRKGLRSIETMPFQTYQLALDIIKKDQNEKHSMIMRQREKLRELKAGGCGQSDRRVISVEQHIDHLRILADANNPRVKYNFDCGVVGIHRPIYRHLLNKKWRVRNRPILMQRLRQMTIIPDVLPRIEPIVDLQVRFRRKKVQPGVILDSLLTEEHPTFNVIPFKRGTMLCTVAVVDPDVPDPSKDGFRYRCHWIVSNISISPTQTRGIGPGAEPSDTIVPYLPPHVQKGAPRHRYAMILFEQSGRIDPGPLLGKIDRDTFTMRSLQAKLNLETIGAFLWRGEWDEHTKGIMQKHNLPGWDIMYTRIKDV